MAEVLGDVTLTAPDAPGHGRSPHWGAQNMHDLATDWAVSLAEEIGGGAPVDLFGHSFGGTVALRVAVERPDLVRSLTLFEPVMFSAAHADQAPEAADWGRDEAEFRDRIEAGDREGAAEWFHARWGNGIALSRMPAAQRAYITERIDAIGAPIDVIHHDRIGMVARLSELKIPVLFVAGGKSPALVHAIGDALERRIAQFSRHVEPGAGHMLPITHTAELAGPLRAHLGL